MIRPGEWSAQEIEALRALWDEKLSSAKIGERLGRSKNSVLGQAHRLGLPGRATPIKRSDQPQPETIRRAPRRTLPLLATVAIVTAAPEPAPAPAPPVIAPRLGRETCRYPLWGNERPSHRYCDAPVALGKSYCPEHHRICWTRQPTSQPGIASGLHW